MQICLVLTSQQFKLWEHCYSKWSHWWRRQWKYSVKLRGHPATGHKNMGGMKDLSCFLLFMTLQKTSAHTRILAVSACFVFVVFFFTVPPPPHLIFCFHLLLCIQLTFAAQNHLKSTEWLHSCQKSSERLTNANPVAGLGVLLSSGYDQMIRVHVTESSSRRSGSCSKSYLTSKIPSALRSCLA